MGQAIVFGAVGVPAVTAGWILCPVAMDPVCGSVIEQAAEVLMDVAHGSSGIPLELREVDIVEASRVVMLADLHAAFEDPSPHFELPPANFVGIDPVAVETAKSVDQTA